ncbi:hypothetical protein [Kitasatospora arboriphila]|uniref:Uncharacterized protein n=1 Tax=Kitasatospora arboriphila TaxID=258052 RepID=A0ABN1TGS4_9ACTN
MEDLGHLGVAMFRVERVGFALSRLEGAVVPDTFVWVRRSAEDVVGALDVLLDALGLDREALAFRGTVETGFEVFDGSTG